MLLDYSTMSTAHLVDLLAQETQKFTQLMMDKEFTAEYNECKAIIQHIQATIESRTEVTISDPNLSFAPPDSSD